MKKLIFVIASMLPAMLLAQGGAYRIEGKITSAKAPEYVYLRYSAVVDSAKVTSGSYVFTGEVPNVTGVYLITPQDGKLLDRSVSLNNLDFLRVMVEGGAPAITVTSGDSLKYGKITGSKINAESERFNDVMTQFNDRVKGLNTKYPDAKTNSESMKAVQAEYDEIMEERKDALVRFVETHPDSYISYNALSTLMQGGDWNPDQMASLLQTMSTARQDSEIGKSIKMRIEAKRATAVGAIAPNFTQNDPEGNPVSLTDFRGRYLLIDFWASWCGPCRAENPNVVKAYERFRDTGFEILGVSLDMPGQKDAWLAAIKKDGLTWPQVSDIQGWKNAVAQLYGINSIPANFLLDPEGRIIAVNLRGEALEQKLEEVL